MNYDPIWVKSTKPLYVVHWNSLKCISEVKVTQLKVKNMRVEMGISTFKDGATLAKL